MRQYFKAAVRSKLIDANPFAEVKAESQANSDRDFFLTRQTAKAVLDACPDNACSTPATTTNGG